MTEYIDKQAFNDAIREAIRRCPNTFYNGLETARQIAHNLPSADVQPVRHGRWISEWKSSYNTGLASCSECECVTGMRWKYCPNCGTHMDGGDTDER